MLWQQAMDLSLLRPSAECPSVLMTAIPGTIRNFFPILATSVSPVSSTMGINFMLTAKGYIHGMVQIGIRKILAKSLHLPADLPEGSLHRVLPPIQYPGQPASIFPTTAD